MRVEAAFQRGFDSALKHFGGVDVMVNNAARTPATSIWDITAAEWDDVMAVNLRGGFFGCRIAGRHMRARRAGRIINLASFAGQQASAATGVHYAASKAGMLALTRAFAQELAPHGVTVNTLSPAAVRGRCSTRWTRSGKRALGSQHPARPLRRRAGSGRRRGLPGVDAGSAS